MSVFLFDLVVQQEISKEGIIWSILSVPAVRTGIQGNTFAEPLTLSEVPTPLSHLSFLTTWQIDEAAAKRSQGKKNAGFGRAAYQEKLIARYVPPATSAAVPIIEPLNGPKASSSIRIESYSTSDGVSKAKATAPPAAAAGSDKGAGASEKHLE